MTTTGAWIGSVDVWVSPVARLPLVGEGVPGELPVVTGVGPRTLVLVEDVAMVRGEADDCAFSRSLRMRSRSLSRSFATDSTYVPISETTFSTFDDLERVRQRNARRDSDVGDAHGRREIRRPPSIEGVGRASVSVSPEEEEASETRGGRGGGGEGWS